MMFDFDKDLYRYYGVNIRLKNKFFLDKKLKYLKHFRKYKLSKGIFRFYHRYCMHMLSKKTMLQIPRQTEIGPGLYLGHNGPIVINPKAKLGANINIAQGVTIGQTNRGKRKGVPEIGNEVWIGTNAVIVGSITVGNNVLIAPNAYVNFDVPDNSIVIGNPAQIHQSSSATLNYINRKIDI